MFPVLNEQLIGQCMESLCQHTTMRDSLKQLVKTQKAARGQTLLHAADMSDGMKTCDPAP